MDLGKGQEHKEEEKQLRDVGLFIPNKKGLRGNLIPLCNYLEGGCCEVRVSLFQIKK